MGAYGVDSQERDLLPSHPSRRDIRHVCPDVSGRRRCHFLSLTERSLLIMHQGTCVEQGAMEEILRHPKDNYTRRLLEAAGVG